MSRFFSCCGEQVVVGAEEAADVGHAVLLGGHGAAVAERNISCAICLGVLIGVAGSRSLMK